MFIYVCVYVYIFLTMYLTIYLSIYINPAFSLFQETLQRLEQEHRKAKDDLQAAESEAREAQAGLVEAKRALQSLKKRHSDTEARHRGLHYELSQQHSLSARHRQMMASASVVLLEEEAVKAVERDIDSATASLDGMARMRMACYEMGQQECLAKDRLYQQVMQARARVTALRSRQESFRHSPGRVEPLKSQVQHLKGAVQSLRQQVC